MADVDIVIPNPPWSSGGSGALESQVQKNLTHAFIMTQPVNIVLTPREPVKQPSGGTKFEDQTNRLVQTMRLIEPGSIPYPVVTLDGIQRRVDFELLGEHDSVIGVYDWFELDGKRWEVVQLAYFNGWEQRALVARFG